MKHERAGFLRKGETKHREEEKGRRHETLISKLAIIATAVAFSEPEQEQLKQVEVQKAGEVEQWGSTEITNESAKTAVINAIDRAGETTTGSIRVIPESTSGSVVVLGQHASHPHGEGMSEAHEEGVHEEHASDAPHIPGGTHMHDQQGTSPHSTGNTHHHAEHSEIQDGKHTHGSGTAVAFGDVLTPDGDIKTSIFSAHDHVEIPIKIGKNTFELGFEIQDFPGSQERHGEIVWMKDETRVFGLRPQGSILVGGEHGTAYKIGVATAGEGRFTTEINYVLEQGGHEDHEEIDTHDKEAHETGEHHEERAFVEKFQKAAEHVEGSVQVSGKRGVAEMGFREGAFFASSGVNVGNMNIGLLVRDAHKAGEQPFVFLTLSKPL